MNEKELKQRRVEIPDDEIGRVSGGVGIPLGNVRRAKREIPANQPEGWFGTAEANEDGAITTLPVSGQGVNPGTTTTDLFCRTGRKGGGGAKPL